MFKLFLHLLFYVISAQENSVLTPVLTGISAVSCLSRSNLRIVLRKLISSRCYLWALRDNESITMVLWTLSTY